jgi:putative PIG3 family NAD(P)H quinone oxidoreductase
MIRVRAVRYRAAGGPEVIEIVERELREPGPGEILVRVAAAGLNRADVVQRRGRYPAPPGAIPDVPGLEYAGEVQAVGSDVQRWKAGDRVMGIVGGGAMSSHVVVHEREAIPVPAELPLVDAAAIPEVFVTAWDALFRQADLRMGERVLIHAVGSGVGTAALQLALAAGARPVGTSRSREKLDRCAALGLGDAVLAENGRFADEANGADVILDTVGASYAAENALAIAPRGRWVIVGLLGGATGDFPFGTLLGKRITIMGTVLRARPLEEKAALAQAFAHEVVPLIAAGRLRPVIDDVLPMERVAEAHERMERNETFGKIVIAM